MTKQAIYKYQLPLNPGEVFEVEYPDWGKTETLTLQTQRGVPHLWVLVPLDEPVVKHQMVWMPTGELPESRDWQYDTAYIGTVQDGPFVWHLFELFDNKESDFLE